MNTILLELDVDRILIYGAIAVFVFILAVLIIRWILGIDKIIRLLEMHNNNDLIQINLLRRMLADKGVHYEEIDKIISEGRNKNDNSDFFSH